MNAIIISVGTELLLGDIINTNAKDISILLSSLGISSYKQITIGDNEKRLLNTISEAYKEADLIIATGGLGPTDDDLTKEVFANYFNLPLIYSTEINNQLEQYFKESKQDYTKGNLKQAYLIENATIIPNNNGTAPGFIVEDFINNKVAILLPGPPNEMNPMLKDTVLPYLKTKTDTTYYSKTLKIVGIGESQAEEMVKDLIVKQSNPTIAPYAKVSEVHFRITASSKNTNEAKQLMQPIIDQFYETFKHHIYGEDEDTLDSIVIDLLKEKKLTIAIAESCSGGLITSTLIDHPGISQYLNEGLVTYSNKSKMKRLNVKEETLQHYGAVSKETAMEMAEGVAKTSNSEIGLSTTGIAGPEGGTLEKPVGLVYIGLYYRNKTDYLELNLKGNRQKIRERTVKLALNFLRRALQEE